MDYLSFITDVYRDQLGRAPDEGGRNYYVEQLTSGAKTMDQVLGEINQSLEGQNYDTQMLTSEYRQAFGRDPEQEGYQYWMNRVQSDPTLSATTVDAYLRGGATGADLAALKAAPQGYTELVTNALQADPYAGRRATESIYGVGPGGVNVSRMGDAYAQFVNPVNVAPIVSTYDPKTGKFTTTAGADVLDPTRVTNAINIARSSGALSTDAANNLFQELTQAKSMTDVYSALSKPQAGVVIDKLYGIQTGEDVNMDKARSEAIARQKVLDTFNYAPSYDAFGQQLKAAGVQNPFTAQAYTAPTMARTADVATPQTFRPLLNQTIQQAFGNMEYVPTPLGGQFYSERGLEKGFIPFGQMNAPQFRSGVAGFTPQLPTGLQYGTETVQAPVNVFTPGQFDPRAASYSQAGVPLSEAGLPLMAAGGGTVTRPEISRTVLGYTSYGEPIYAPMSTGDSGGS